MQKHASDYEVSCLVRNSDKGAQVASRWANIRLVYGDLDSSDVLEMEAKRADVVLRTPPTRHFSISNLTGDADSISLQTVQMPITKEQPLL